MDSSRNKIKLLTEYIESFGIKIHLNTAARGNNGFYLKNRIDISKKIPKDKIIPTLLHEFAHYLYSIDSSFDVEGRFEELIRITNFVDENSKCTILKQHKDIIKTNILEQEAIIKNAYPKFQRSKPFKEFDKFIKHSKAKYLLKYDRVKYITPFLRRVKYYSIDNLEKDFKMCDAFYAYIRLRSYQRKQNRISSKINRLRKYYTKPTELFARFIEGLYIDSEKTKILAPNTYKYLQSLFENNHYIELDKALSMALK